MQFDLLKRREFITLLGGAMGWPLSARAQQPPRPHPLVGYLITGTKDGLAPDVSAFLNRLRDLGYIEGQNIEIAKRYADADSARLPALAAELVQLQPNLILAFDPPAAVAARKTTASIPIVAAILNDPLRLGLIASYARPGGNVTGILSQVEGLPGKQIEIARELIPAATVIGVLVNPTNPTNTYQRREIEDAGAAKAIKVIGAETRAKADLDDALNFLRNAQVQVAIVLRDAMFVSERRHIAELAMAMHLPTIGSQNSFVEAGGLISYGIDNLENHRRAADFVDKILKGAKPAELPVEFPTKLVLSINMKTAKALGLEMPLQLQQLADKVIE
jgi:putative tryptophan/tyrosine transport system substrate-binding protein